MTAPQRVIKIRRDYNAWVASETLEDYALRFTPRASRKWSSWRVANTAFGASSFLVLEAVGATLLVQYGFVNAALAILATGLLIFLAGLPISAYAARYGVDMDLLTRGAGFGYIGSTLTSLIYASFTFIFFALEAAVMAYALDLAFDIPPAWGYLICALLVIPLVTHGVTVISRLQVWTQPVWLVLLVLPYVYVFQRNPGIVGELALYGGERGLRQFDAVAFGSAMTMGIALITQMGEQADYLRFMPEGRPGEPIGRQGWRWWLGTLVGGPGWVIPGVLKMLGGALLAFLALEHMVPVERAVDPNQMYLAAYEYVFPHYGWAVAATTVLVVVSQLKINVTNAYAGSLAWSNFFSRVAHSHPGRVVWVVFNTLIALMLMELDVFQALGRVLGLYANIAIAWMMAVVADLVINKPLGLSPPGIEFRRAYLYDINPVGVGAMGIASVLSVVAHLGVFGELAQAYSALIALLTAFIAAPLIAWRTGGRYYLARRPAVPADAGLPADDVGAPMRPGQGGVLRLKRCCICEREYEVEDTAHCPAYQGDICSLCCTLDVRCHDLCKPEARLAVQWSATLRAVLPSPVWPYLDRGLGHYILLMLAVIPLLALLLGLLYQHELGRLDAEAPESLTLLEPALRLAFLKAYAALLLVSGVVAWWLVLAHQSRVVAQEESNRQTQALNDQASALRHEIELRRQTDRALQEAKGVAESANQAKSRYISAISHELRTPLNSILGYAQLLDEDESIPEHRRQAVRVIRRGGDHLLSLIEGTLDIARIESGKLRLEPAPMQLREGLQQIARLFELQAAAKGIGFVADLDAGLPQLVRADEKRLRQILINLLGNAVKFTREGEVRFHARHSREMARFEIHDTGPGMTADELERVFEPFERGGAAAATSGGTGLGLTISKMLTELMGGEMTVESRAGQGTTFHIRLFLPELRAAEAVQVLRTPARTGYLGPRRRILVVDNEQDDRGLLVSLLEPLGFEIHQAASGHECLTLLQELPPERQPDALFMDLAMPGIDGWETLRRMRAGGLSDAPAAIVSANAFDQSLDNDVGITTQDFIVKPVRLSLLLDWLERRLALEWTRAAPVATPASTDPAGADAGPPPSRAQLEALQELVTLGYLRGIVRRLDQIDAEEPEARACTARLRTLARQFQLEAMSGLIRQALHDHPTA
nr:ATP-binding protein [Sphaerotilus hippei]